MGGVGGRIFGRIRWGEPAYIASLVEIGGGYVALVERKVGARGGKLCQHLPAEGSVFQYGIERTALPRLWAGKGGSRLGGWHWEVQRGCLYTCMKIGIMIQKQEGKKDGIGGFGGKMTRRQSTSIQKWSIELIVELL